jgi:hypothetical protein
VTLGGTVSFADLAPLTSADITSTDIKVYSGPVQLTSATVEGGAWTAALPPDSGYRPVRIVASVHLINGGQIDDYIEVIVPASRAETESTMKNLNFAPASIESGVWSGPVTVYAGSNGTWLLWIPETAGEYVLDAERIDDMDPHMYLYDGITGNLLDNDDNDGGNLNSRIRRTNFVAERPYMVQVKEVDNLAGTFRFRAEVAP